MKLNIGCGKDIRAGFVNIDWNPWAGVDVVCDACALPFADESAAYILANDILEHFSWRETRAVLGGWTRVLKAKGLLELRVPSLEGLIRLYLVRPRGWRLEDGRGVDPVVERLFGGQDFPGNTHMTIFDSRSLEELLRDDYRILELGPDGHDISNLRVVARRRPVGPVKHHGCSQSRDQASFRHRPLEFN